MLPGVHWPELLVVLLIAAMLFGAKRLPELGSSVGKAIREFQKSIHEIADPVKDALTLPPPAPQPPSSTPAPSETAMQQAEVAAPMTVVDQATAPQSAHLVED